MEDESTNGKEAKKSVMRTLFAYLLIPFRRQRTFLTILMITTAVWIFVSMSSRQYYPVQVHITWTGFDSSRYAVVEADTALTLNIESNWFQAFSRQHTAQNTPLVISTSHDTAIKTTALASLLQNQLGFDNTNTFTSEKEHIKIRLSQRVGKPFVPILRGISFSFTEQHALSGKPILQPDTVWLYGSQQSLNNIDSIYTAAATLIDISDSGIYRIPLEPVWEKYPDVYPSVKELEMFIPVQEFTERKITVPVRLVNKTDAGSHKRQNIRIYPEQVEITVWCSALEYNAISETLFDVVAEYNPASADTTLPVRIATFPSQMRIKQIVPANLQYVIIK